MHIETVRIQPRARVFYTSLLRTPSHQSWRFRDVQNCMAISITQLQSFSPSSASPNSRPAPAPRHSRNYGVCSSIFCSNVENGAQRYGDMLPQEAEVLRARTTPTRQGGELGSLCATVAKVSCSSLKSLPRWLRRRTLAHTPLISSPFFQPFLGGQFQLSIQFSTRFFPVYKIAEPSSDTSFSAVQSTTCFSEIRDRGKLAVYRSSGVPPRVERVAGLLCRVFVFKSRINVTD
jgi:hypothetical protein